MSSQERVEVVVPPELEEGVFADVVGIWHTPYAFTVDFMTAVTPGPVPDPENPGESVRRLRTVARVRIPPAVIFPLLQALNENQTRYENAFGEIRQPAPPEER